MSLTLIGLGVRANDLSLGALEKIKNAEVVIVKSALIENYKFLATVCEPIALDDEYKRSRNFDTLCKNVSAKINALSRGKQAVYCVDGSVLEDNVCKHYISRHPGVEIISGVSKVSAAMERLGFSGGYSAVSAYDVNEFFPSGEVLCVYDIDSQYLAGEVKLRLVDFYGDECPCVVFYGEEQKSVLLYELDRLPRYDYTTRLAVLPRPFLQKDAYTYADLYKLMELLRGENGCPWDRAQTHESIRTNAIEEIYEMVDAIDRHDDDRLREEIGDVFMQAIFHTQLGEARFALTQGEVLSGVCKKLISRHTHIFFGEEAGDDKQALDVWDKNKTKEHGFTPLEEVADVAKCFPALMRTQKVQKRSVKAGWDCGSVEQSKQKISSLLARIEKNDNPTLTRDLGDLLFECVNLTRLLGGDSEMLLKDTTDGFIDDLMKGNG